MIFFFEGQGFLANQIMSMLYTKTKIERGKIRMGPKKQKNKKRKKGEKQTKGLCKVSFDCINFKR